MNKKMKKLLTVLISVLMLLMLVGCSSGGNKNETPSETQTTETVEGRTAIVFKHYDGKAASLIRNNETQETYEGMRLMANDELVTDKDTIIYLRVDDDKNILLDKDTSMKIKELKDGKLSMELNYGAFFFDVENKLQDGEDMSFEIGGTTMSIRGTSGQGELRENDKSFSIFTGLGHVEDGQGMAIDLNPGLQVSTDTKDSEGRYRLSLVGGSDILDATKKYLDEIEEYKNKVDDSKWVRELNGEVVDDSQVEQPTQKGWILNEDGSWVYVGEQAETDTQTNTNNNTGYRPPIIIPVYEPEEEEPVPAPAPTPEPTPEPTPAPEPTICKHCGNKIAEGEELIHTLSLSSSDGKAYLISALREQKIDKTPEGGTIESGLEDLCGEHYICELNPINFDEIYKYKICHQEDCDICNTDEELIQCKECYKFFCEEHYNAHFMLCKNCNENTCLGHLTHCNHCDEDYYTCDEDSSIHTTSCPRCGHYECEKDYGEYHVYNEATGVIDCNYPIEQQESIIELGD